MPANRGGTSPGSFRVLPPAPQRLDRCWIARQGSGRARSLAPRTTSSVPTKRPVSRPVSAAIPRCHPRRADRLLSRTQTSAAAPCHIWRHGMYAAGMAWDGVNRQLASYPVAAWSTKCWRRNRTGPANACSGSWTTVRRIAVPPRCSGCVRSLLVSFWSIPQSPPVGSIKSKSLSRSSNGECLHPMTLPIWKRSDVGWPSTKNCPTKAQRRCSGSLLALNWQHGEQRSRPVAWPWQMPNRLA